MGRDMKEYMEKLRKVGVAVGAQLDGANEVKDEPEVDMSQWTEYEKGRYQVTKRMSEIREDLSSLQEMEKGGDTTKKTHLSNKVRKNIRAMKAEASSLKAEAEKSQKLPEYDELIKHMKKTEKLHTQRYRPKNAREDDDGLGALGGGGFDTGREMRSIQDLTDPSNPQGDLTESLLDPAEDEEFQMFYQGVKQRDQEIDAGLDRIAAGLERVKINALGIQDQLQEQNLHLENINIKAEQQHAQMMGLNKKLKSTLKEVEKDKYCCYLICLLLVIGVLGVVGSQTGLFK